MLMLILMPCQLSWLAVATMGNGQAECRAAEAEAVGRYVGTYVDRIEPKANNRMNQSETCEAPGGTSRFLLQL